MPRPDYTDDPTPYQEPDQNPGWLWLLAIAAVVLLIVVIGWQVWHPMVWR